MANEQHGSDVEPRPYSGRLTYAEYITERERILAEDRGRISTMRALGFDQFGRPLK